MFNLPWSKIIEFFFQFVICRNAMETNPLVDLFDVTLQIVL